MITLTARLPNVTPRWSKVWSRADMLEHKAAACYFALTPATTPTERFRQEVTRAILQLPDFELFFWLWVADADEEIDAPISIERLVRDLLPDDEALKLFRMYETEMPEILVELRVDAAELPKLIPKMTRQCFERAFDGVFSYSGVALYLQFPDGEKPNSKRGRPKKIDARAIQKLHESCCAYYREIEEPGAVFIPEKWKVPGKILQQQAKEIGVSLRYLKRFVDSRAGGMPTEKGWERFLEAIEPMLAQPDKKKIRFTVQTKA